MSGRTAWLPGLRERYRPVNKMRTITYDHAQGTCLMRPSPVPRPAAWHTGANSSRSSVLCGLVFWSAMSAARLRTVSSIPTQLEQSATDQVGTHQRRCGDQERDHPVHQFTSFRLIFGSIRTALPQVASKTRLDDEQAGRDILVLELLLVFLRRRQPCWGRVCRATACSAHEELVGV